MLYNIYKVTLVSLLCGVICEVSCNTLSEKIHADVKEQISEMEERFNERFEKLENNIESINDAVAKMVLALLEGKPQTLEPTHDVKKREVISNNPLTNLPFDDLARLRGEPGKDGRDGKDGVSGGAVYTRWGRTTCGSDSQLLYKGYAGGSNYDQPGGGVNYQCMPLDPQYSRFFDGSGTWYGSYIAGVEYQTYYYGTVDYKAHDQNAPCARCYTNNRSALMMIPAKRDCSEGWTKEYEGYLMTEDQGHNHQSTFECVDESPEYVDGEVGNDDGGLFNGIRTDCSRGGYCPPYEGNKEMTCVVCSK